MHKPAEAERISSIREERPAPVYAPDEPKSTMTKCMLVTAATAAGITPEEIAETGVVDVWAARAVKHGMTPDEIKGAFDWIADHQKWFPSWHEFLETVQLDRVFRRRAIQSDKPKSLPEPVSADQRKALTAKMDALTVGVSMNRGEDRKPRARTPVIITDAERAEGQRQIERLRG